MELTWRNPKDSSKDSLGYISAIFHAEDFPPREKLNEAYPWLHVPKKYKGTNSSEYLWSAFSAAIEAGNTEILYAKNLIVAENFTTPSLGEVIFCRFGKNYERQDRFTPNQREYADLFTKFNAQLNDIDFHYYVKAQAINYRNISSPVGRMSQERMPAWTFLDKILNEFDTLPSQELLIDLQKLWLTITAATLGASMEEEDAKKLLQCYKIYKNNMNEFVELIKWMSGPVTISKAGVVGRRLRQKKLLPLYKFTNYLIEVGNFAELKHQVTEMPDVWWDELFA